MVSDFFARGTGLISARWRMRLTLAALIVATVACSCSPYRHLAVGPVVLLLALFFLGRRRVPPTPPPWVPPWQGATPLAPPGRSWRPRRVSSWRLSRARGWCAQDHRMQAQHILATVRRRWGNIVVAVAAAVQAAPARLRVQGRAWADAFAALPSRLSRPAPVTSMAMPGVVAALTAEAECALADAGVLGQVVVIESTRRTVTLTLQASDLSTASRQVRDALRAIAPAVRWSGMDQLRVSLPLVRSPGLDQAPRCVPILRRRSTTLWWPLMETRPLVLAGDARLTLHALLDTLAGSPGLLLYDPEQTLTAPAIASDHWPAHTPDALALACAHALRTAYRRRQAPDAPLPAPLTLLVVPDAAAWRDLTPLLTQLDDGGVQLILALTTGAHHPAAQDACRRGQVVEVGALGHAALPEACRPPGLTAPRPGMVLAWQTPHLHWRGLPIRRA